MSVKNMCGLQRLGKYTHYNTRPMTFFDPGYEDLLREVGPGKL